jgi:toxin ParE1/3/4
MKRYSVSFRPAVEADLFGLYRHIAKEAGIDVAWTYVERLEADCIALATFPQRGAKRDDISPGLRTMGFERRATIVFQVKKSEVVIVRIFYGGRDYERIMRREPED